MIRALIIEDEKPAAEHLQRLISQLNIKIEVETIISSIEDAIAWFKNKPMPDLIFLDIQLSDGLSFELFNHFDITCPIIFTTAYEEYAIKAFKVNSVDYLLKPIKLNDLDYAVNKYMLTANSLKGLTSETFRSKIDLIMKMLTNNYKSRFIVNAGIHIKSIDTEKTSMFYSLGKSTFLLDDTGKSYDINYSLEQIEKLIDPDQFFRISRKYIVNIKAITDIITYSASRLQLKVQNSKDDEITVSRSKLKEFKQWLEK